MWSHAVVGEYDTAHRYFLRELEISRANFGEWHMRTALAYNNLGMISRRMGKLERALEHLQRSLEIIRESGAGQLQIPGLYLNMGNTWEDLGQLEVAAEHFEAGLAHEGLAEGDRRIHSFLLNNFGSLLVNLGEDERGAVMVSLATALSASRHRAILAMSGGSLQRCRALAYGSMEGYKPPPSATARSLVGSMTVSDL